MTFKFQGRNSLLVISELPEHTHAWAHVHTNTFLSYKRQFFKEIVDFGNRERSHRTYF